MGQVDKLYEKIPSSICKNGCYKCCTNMIQYTQSELKAMGGYDYQGVCSHLINGKCSIYENRPFVCRIFGTSELLRCNDCLPNRFLSDDETYKLIHEYTKLMKKEEKEKQNDM